MTKYQGIEQAGWTLGLVILCAMALTAQDKNDLGWADAFENHYSVKPDIVYAKANNIPLRLDLWERQDTSGPVPTVVYIHGGGWVLGTKGEATPSLMPYLRRGWNVVNVEYRLAGESLAPAAVEDARCALRWVFQNGREYHLDTNHLIVTGHSAGGHLALMTGMLTPAAGFDNEWPSGGSNVPRVSAIVNWYGITDVADLLEGENRKEYATAWLAGLPDPLSLSRKLSPLTYVRSELPPIITIHGDADPTVPYSHAVRLHKALDQVHSVNRLITVHGGGHGNFNDAQVRDSYREVWEFLNTNIPGLPKELSK